MDKANTTKLLNETFNSDFDINRFAKFVKELFNEFSINQKSWSVWQEYQDYIESYVSLGNYTDKAKKVIDVLVVKLKKSSSRDRARTMQRNFIAKYLSNAEKDAALVAFYGEDNDWRFSFVKMEYNLVKDESGKTVISKELTPAKRYSFLVGVNEPNHTCRRQFLELVMQDEINPSVDEIESAFSIDNVTKEFFDEYKELFLELEECLQKVKNRDKHVEEEFESKGISTVDFAKKLLGQIVFIYFLQKKGWLGVKKGEKWGDGPKDFMRCLFGGGIRNYKPLVPYKNFFNEILEPLFYEALANDRSADDHFYRLFNCKIPFLNGGLFEPINDYKWAETDIVIDNTIFDRILTTFDRFNFTVKEDEPLEKEVAVDPEMLGKVFENLLEVKDRKSKGAFYTPREIVHYMCQQSLINYLETNTTINRKDIEKFIQLGDLALDMIIKEQEQVKKYGRSYDIKEEYSLPKSIKENYKEIDRLLKEIKIVDPAVGSGAFPVGMMNEIIKARSILSMYFHEKRSDYDLKREIIENCLYGVDIESSAVDITKLRFWLSLIVDELDMQNIKPLPNLDHKIMCGNSLLEEFEGVKLFDEKLLGEVKKDVSFEVKQIEKEIAELYVKKGDIVRGKSNGSSVKEVEKDIKKLENKRQKLLSAPKDSSRDMTLDEATQHRIKESQRKLSELKSLQKDFFNAENRNLKKQLREKIDKIEWELIEETLKEQGNLEAMQKLSQYQKNKAKPFFLWKLYFAEVFQRENPGFDVVIANPPYVNVSNLNSLDRNQYKKKYSITKNKVDLYAYFIELGTRILRKEGSLTYIIPHTWKATSSFELLRKLIFDKMHFLKLVELTDKTFEATVKPVVIVLKNQIEKDYDITVLNDSFDEINLINIQEVLSKKDYAIDTVSTTQDKKIFDKIEQASIPLGSILKFTRGIKTSNDKRFISKEPFKEDNYKVIRGRDIIKWQYSWNGEYIWYRPDLMREKVGCLPHTKELFVNKDKILLQRISRGIVACYDNQQIFSLDTTLVSVNTPIKEKTDKKYILGLLNSKLINFWYGKKFVLPTVSGYELHQIPIKIDQESNKYITIVNQILSITKSDDYLDNPDKKSKVKRLEKEIDKLVYKLYELTPEEIKIVEEFDNA
ncbi:MAG TPA: TaqI-like C-terminal specificity domain-containing protein [Candidatus Woesearchaeota archaeon]|nr:TaqI-like C-terminal specificity domain-containing protein [Candidatus Woesearchaeota archaeon]